MRKLLLVSLTTLFIAACVKSEPAVDPSDDDSTAGDTSTAGSTGVAGAGVAGSSGAGVAGSPGTAGAGTAGAGTAGAGTAGAGTAGAGTAGAGTAGAGTAGAGTSGAGGAGTAGAGTSGSAGAGTAGMGGMAPKPAYGHGVQSATITQTDATTAYNTWKSALVKTCSNGELRVDNGSGLTVSEGIGYGMLLAVGNNDRTTFDGLWKYYTDRKDNNGLMNWQYSGCGTGASMQNGASDADLDTAMALLQADKKWGGYKSNATSLLSAIKQHELSGSTLLPGDSGFNLPCVNYSYFAPGYYRVFADASVTGDSSWTTAASTAYSVINGAANGTTGLVPDWQSSCPSSEANKNNYYYDATRTPWRVAVDFVWWGTPEASTYLNKLVTFAGSNLSTFNDGYMLNGTKLSPPTGPNSSFVGPMACAGMAATQMTIDNYAFSLKYITGETGYYDLSLRALTMLLLSGNFVRPV